mgnify:CR=1 FL=1
MSTLIPDGGISFKKLGDDIVVRDKNIFTAKWEQKNYDSNGNCVSVTSNNHTATQPEIAVNGGKIYAISWGSSKITDTGGNGNLYIYQFDVNGNMITRTQSLFNNYSYVFTTDTNTTHIGFSIYSFQSNPNWKDLIPSWFHVEEGRKIYTTSPVESIRIDRINVEEISEKMALNQGSGVVRTIAHRGDDIYAPQCTAPAYIVAKKHGHSIMENDLMLTKDGHLVMWHDPNLSRLGNLVDINGYHMYTDGNTESPLYYWVDSSNNTVYTYDTDYVVSNVELSSLTRCIGSDYGVNSTFDDVIALNFDILRRIDFGVWFDLKYKGTQILTFEEWILLCKQLGSEVYVDSKLTYTDEIITEAASIVKKYGMGEYTSWLGFGDIGKINKLREIISGARVGVLWHPTQEAIETYKSINEVGRGFFFNGDAKNGMTNETIQLGLNAGYDVEVWYVDYGTANREAVLDVLRTAVSYGVTGITTDHYRTDEAFKYILEQY